ncbi:MAG: hypothetical protein ACJAT4_002620 [Granulosicoccus sp.]|jgi:hypothetical protein
MSKKTGFYLDGCKKKRAITFATTLFYVFQMSRPKIALQKK